MRGKLPYGVEFTQSVGLIPAHAGKTLARSLARTLARAHPRACGENLKGQLEAVTGGGSSPRMRGKLAGDLAPAMQDGLIPAHAGKTRCVS